MGKKVLILMDYLTTTDGYEHYGSAEIFKNYLLDKRIEFQILKNRYTFNLIEIISKSLKTFFHLKENNYSHLVGYNFINALILKIIQVTLNKKCKVIYICLDFSPNRFSSKFLNYIYVYLDRLASKVSDSTYSASKRIYDYRSIFLNSDKNFFLPNIPYGKIKNLTKFEKYTIVMISFLGNNYFFDEVFDLFNFIKGKDIQLFIIGDGELRDLIQNKILENSLQNQVFLKGYLKQSEVFEILERSHLGLALYAGLYDYNFWGDSLKIREYTHYGLPVITTKNVYNEKEVSEYNLGIVLNSPDELTEKVKSLFENSYMYNSITKSIDKYNKLNNPETILSSILT